MQTFTIDILSEEFEMPDTHIELGALITICIDEYNEMQQHIRTTTLYKRKLNELIGEYNDRRGMKLIPLL